MPNLTAKSHKSRKTDGESKPRQRNSGKGHAPAPLDSSPDAGSSSGTSVTPASVASITLPSSTLRGEDVPAPLPKEQQPWYRKPDSKLRKQADKIAVMRAAGRPVASIAKKLDTSEANVRFVEYIARKNGWYDEDDEPVDLEAELALTLDRKIVRNVDASLDGQMTNWQTHEMTMAAAKGRGIFKNHDKVETEQTQLSVVAIQVVMPPVGAKDQQVLDETNIGGTPAYLEGETLPVPQLQETNPGDMDGTRMGQEDRGGVDEASSSAVSHSA